MIGKICDLCGKMYVPYGVVVEQEDSVVEIADIYDSEQIELFDDSLEESEPDDASGEVPEENGFRFLTIDPYGGIQYEHDKYDLCPDCMAQFKALIESRRGINEESGS